MSTEQSGRGQQIQLDRVSLAYGAISVIEGLSLTVGAGEFFTLLGPSGCGKTTTLRLVAGLLSPSMGSIYLGERDVTRTPVHRRDVAMVFQNYALMPHLSLRDNVAYGLASRRVPRRERREQADVALTRVGLEGFGDRYPAQLSGGQQQRVGLARAVAVGSGVMLLDEPLSNLDTSLRQQMCLELRELQQDLGVTILYVTHDRSEALSMSDRIAVMADGRIVGLGTPEELYERPSDLRIARMLGDVVELRGTASSGALRLGSIAVRASQELADGPAVLAVRPERIQVVPAGSATDGLNVLEGRIRRREYGGAQLGLVVEADELEKPLVARIPAEHAEGLPPEGETVRLGWRVADTLVMGARR